MLDIGKRYAIALSSLLPSCSSCLRGSLKKDVGELRSAILCVFAPLRLCAKLSVFSVSLWFVKKGYWEVEGVRSLFGELRGCDRCWEVGGGAIAFGGLKGAIAVWELRGCDRCLGVEGVRSLFGS